MSRLGSMLVVVVLTSLTGCTLVGSVHPLSDAKTSTADDRLVGEWISLDPKSGQAADNERLTIRKADQGIAYVAVNHEGEESALFTTEIGDRRFLSAAVRAKEAPVRYLILQYELRDDQLRMFLMHPDKVAAAIAEGRIAGDVVREDPPANDPNAETKLKEVTLAASGEQLREFLASKMGQAVMHTDEPAMLFKRAPK
jgi:hypothetical protein